MVVVVASAGLFLVLCLATLWWATRASSVGVRHTLFVFVWLCAALTATLVTFSLLPATTADGTVFGVTLGGAGAFVILVWTAALRAGNWLTGTGVKAQPCARRWRRPHGATTPRRWPAGRYWTGRRRTGSSCDTLMMVQSGGSVSSPVMHGR